MSAHIPGSDLYAPADAPAPANAPESAPTQGHEYSELNSANNSAPSNGHQGAQYSISQSPSGTVSQSGPLNGISATQLLGKSATPRVEVKLFIGRLPRTMEDSELTPMFTPYGDVLETVIIRDKATNAHKGSAFIKMASITDADAAIRDLHNIKVVDNQLGPIQVKYANGEAERLGLPVDSAQPGNQIGKLFIGSLPRGVSEADVRQIFEPYGAIEEVVLMKDAGTGQTKGCAFVKYKLKETAIHAIKMLHGQHQCPGCPRPLEVKFAESRRAAPQAAQPATGANSAAQGYPASARPQAAAPSNMNPRSAGGWTEYFTHDGRAYYHSEATGVTQWVKPVEFDRLMSPPITAGGMGGTSVSGNSADVTGPPGANVFVFHIPNEWTQADVIQHFSPFGRVISCYIATDKTTGRNKGYGFVSFDNVESSAQAVINMNGFLAGSKRLKVSIKTGEEEYVAHIISAHQSGQATQAQGQQPMGMGGYQRAYQSPQAGFGAAAGYGPAPGGYGQYNAYGGASGYGGAAGGAYPGAGGSYGQAPGNTGGYGNVAGGSYRSSPY